MNIEGKFNKKENKAEILAELRTALDESLFELTSKLNKYEVPYFLDSGSLLGPIRNGCSLSGDSDHDISIKIEDLMSENGQRFLRENVANFKRCQHSSRTHDKQKIELFSSATDMLGYFEAGQPFSPVNLGYETLYDSKPYKFKSHGRRAPLKIDIFILYPWERIQKPVDQQGLDQHNDSHVYILPFHGVHYCKMDNKFLGRGETIISALESFAGPIKHTMMSCYTNPKDYLTALYGADWETPSKSYNWFHKKYQSTKIHASELLNQNITNTAEIQQNYLFCP